MIIWVNEENMALKKTLRIQINGKFNDIRSADENK
jgi:hypothetical protein